jgi:plasmid stability protein
MASVSVRNIDDGVYERLKIRAAMHGVSMEEEVRRIIQRSVASPERLGHLALECFGAANGVELEPPVRQPHEPVDLSG